MRRTLLCLGALQAALVALYLGIGASRPASSPFRVEGLDAPAPDLAWERPGARGELPRDGAVVVHFWATWCGPCRKELPSLIAAAEAEGVRLIAVSDEPWPTIAAFVGEPVPDAIVSVPSGAAGRDWQITGLPDTFLVRNGRIAGRVGEARDWTTPAARRFLRGDPP